MWLIVKKKSHTPHLYLTHLQTFNTTQSHQQLLSRASCRYKTKTLLQLCCGLSYHLHSCFSCSAKSVLFYITLLASYEGLLEWNVRSAFKVNVPHTHRLVQLYTVLYNTSATIWVQPLSLFFYSCPFSILLTLNAGLISIIGTSPSVPLRFGHFVT